MHGVDATQKEQGYSELFPGYGGKSKLASVFFGNVTALGKKSESFMAKRKSHFWGAAETHLDEAKKCEHQEEAAF